MAWRIFLNEGPWGRKGRGGEEPPTLGDKDIDDLIRKSQERFKNMMPPGSGGSQNIIIMALTAIALIWLATGFYRVSEGEQTAVMRFGKLDRIAGPGLRYHLPYPIETYKTVRVTEVNVVQSGVADTSAKRYSGKDAANLILTGDENIVKLTFTVQWVVKDLSDFLFNDKDPRETVNLAANSAVREVIAQTKFADILTTGKGKLIQDSKRVLQKMCDEYGLGIEITKVNLEEVSPPDMVIEAFRDVQKARSNREQKINEAKAYENSIIPVARGEAERIIQNSEAYKQALIDQATGKAAAFDAVYDEYKNAPDVTIKRLEIENFEKVFAGLNKLIVSGDRTSQGVLPYLPIKDLTAKKADKEKGDQQ